MSIGSDIWRGKSLVRILMNREVARHEIQGTVLDVGAGHDPEYHALFKKSHPILFKTFDLKEGIGDGTHDIETMPLPIEKESADAVILFNILEHVYRHNFVVSETHRVLKNGGKLFGFVPFLLNYHPDPHDYFRYTREAIERILRDAGFIEMRVSEIGGGPFLVNYNNIVIAFPRIFRILFVALLPFYFLLDRAYLLARPAARRRFPLGYFFVARK